MVTLAAVAQLLAGCGGDSVSSDAAPTKAPPAKPPATSPPTVATQGLLITTAGSDFGTMLFDRVGQAIYLFDKEKTNAAECYGACAKAWPPVLTNGAPQGSQQVRPNLLGTTQRTDGTTQVTYAGHPLYYYAHESPRQVLCHNVVEFGGRWLVVTPEGTAAA